MRDLVSDAAPRPGAVVQPRSIADVQTTIVIANANRTPIIPFGLGSGVCGGVISTPESLVLDLSRMNQTREIDEVNLLASFDAGKNGMEAENDVAAKGLTIGHWPQSIAVSSVGGWIATRASGQFSSAYGNIEDIVYAVEAVTPNGEVITTGKAPRASAGPDLRHLFLGSEGTLGVITGVTLSLRRAAAAQTYSVFFCSNMDSGFEAQRQIIQAGWQPPVMRQYDNSESTRHFGEDDVKDQCVLLMVHEGDPDALTTEKAKVSEIASKTGLISGPEKIAEHWLEHRNNVPDWSGFINGNIVVDTVEVSAPWTKIGAIYDSAVSKLSQVPGVLAGTAHSSHVYRSGLNLYFTFAVRVDDKKDMEKTYLTCWDHILEATAAKGGGVAHHHGIGRVRRNYLEHDLGANGIALLRSIKATLDPNNIMNPGVLIPDV